MSTSAALGTRARIVAARVLAEVLGRGHSLAQALPAPLATLTDTRERGFAQELCYGVLRHRARLRALCAPLLARPLAARDLDVECLLLAALHQLDTLEGAPHGAVHGAVEAARALGKPWAAGLVNAVLRRFLRERSQCLARVANDTEARHDHPQWLIEALGRDWPDDWEAICTANNQRPPFTLRVNARRLTRDEYLELLAEHGIGARATHASPQGVVLSRPCDVRALPGFAQGLCSVQDEAAQLAAGLLDVAAGQRVLDACAAPGGKTAHLLEYAPGIRLIALDHDAARLARVRENLARLELDAQLVCADARDSANWWDGIPFERILLDAPCSASGVLRRHPDGKWLKQAADLPALAAQQARLLDALWPLLAPGGMLLYATCSVFDQENAAVIARFLAHTSDAKALPIMADWGRACRPGRQILPGQGGMDGFYYARLAKS